MSNYKLTSPIDVFTSSSNAQLNLYESSGTYAVQIKAPSLTSNIPFNLPASSGSTGQYLTFNTGSASTWSTATTVRQILPINISFITALSSGSSVGTGGPFTVGTISFFGTSINDAPTSLYAVIGGVAGTNVVVSLVDVTNAVTIGTSAAVTTTTNPQIVQLPITGAINSTEAVWTVQLSCTAGTARIWSFHILQ